ncbi:uncharacterized protein LOC128249860 [Octopus bimaculoides]|uniref:Uncharacterized protein n=1 Tax=Octopus bimaculoides TaxID=37653 RepID=A0A0L8GTC5_OCTBM|nr:uncharacterized protein LOC128249860 [Octopus bimaculoides]
MEKMIIAAISLVFILQGAIILDAKCVPLYKELTVGASIRSSCPNGSSEELCPSKTVINNNTEHRLPMILLERRCCTKFCFSGKPHVCKEQYMGIIVMERLTVNDPYVKKNINISVGCVCMRKRETIDLPEPTMIEKP